MLRRVLIELAALAVAVGTYAGVSCVTPSTNRTAGDVKNDTTHRFSSPDVTTTNTNTQTAPVTVYNQPGASTQPSR